MVQWGDRPCPDCAAARQHHITDGCGPALPAAFYDDPRLTAALARLDFGPVFRRVCAEKHWSQTVLGGLLGLDQAAISKIENGRRRLTEAVIIIRVANVLGIPAGKLGLRYGVTVEPTGQEGGGMEGRRDVLDQVAALAVGAGLPLDRLIALFPSPEPTGTRHLGMADVEAIEWTTAELIRQDFATGAGPIRDLVVAQLQAVLPLRGAQMAPEVRPRLYLATAELALMAGYLSFDVLQHDAARRLWMIGLGLARSAEDSRGADLTVYLLYDMAAQAVSLGLPDEALRLVHLGHAAAVGPYPVCAATRSCLANIQARAHAAQGDAQACDRSLGQAEEHFAAIDPASTPLRVAHLDDAGLAAYQGAAHYALARPERDPVAASRAVSLLRYAVDGFGPDYARVRALYLPDLAGAHALAGDVDTAVTLGHQAVDAATSVHSPRTYDRLQVMHTVLAPLHTSPGVAELRDRLTTTAT